MHSRDDYIIAASNILGWPGDAEDVYDAIRPLIWEDIREGWIGRTPWPPPDPAQRHDLADGRWESTDAYRHAWVQRHLDDAEETWAEEQLDTIISSYPPGYDGD